MKCKRVQYCDTVAIISYSGDGRDYRIQVDGKVFVFEFSARFGPFALGKAGQVLDRQPGPKHKFWWAVSSWVEHGKRVDDEGFCIWFTETEDILEHVARNHYMLIGETEAVLGS